MDEAERALLAEAEETINDAMACEILGELVRMHCSVARLLDALELRIQQVAEGSGI